MKLGEHPYPGILLREQRRDFFAQPTLDFRYYSIDRREMRILETKTENLSVERSFFFFFWNILFVFCKNEWQSYIEKRR